jgi:hypothetical protein
MDLEKIGIAQNVDLIVEKRSINGAGIPSWIARSPLL